MTQIPTAGAPAKPEGADRQPSRAAGLAALETLFRAEEHARSCLDRGEAAVAYLDVAELDAAARYLAWLRNPVAQTGAPGEEPTWFDAVLAQAREVLGRADTLDARDGRAVTCSEAVHVLRELHDAFADYHEAARADLAAQDEHLAELTTLHLKELHLEEHRGLRMRLAGRAATHVAQCFLAYFLEHGAENVIEMTFTPPGQVGVFYTVAVQKHPGKTPMMLVADAVRERDYLLGRIRAREDGESLPSSLDALRTEMALEAAKEVPRG